jgi:hypothetical protein
MLMRARSRAERVLFAANRSISLRGRFESRLAESAGVVFENRSGANSMFVSTGSAENRIRWPDRRGFKTDSESAVVPRIYDLDACGSERADVAGGDGKAVCGSDGSNLRVRE